MTPPSFLSAPGKLWLGNALIDLQGWAKVRFPGSVNMRWKICVFLPAAGRKGGRVIFASYSQKLASVLMTLYVDVKC